MHRIVITRPEYDFDAEQWTAETVCSFTVGPQGIVQVDTGGEQIPRRVAVVDPQTGRDVTLESDPERWAVLLQSAFRSGDLTVTLDDDEPEVESGADRGRSPVMVETIASQAIHH